MDGPLLAARGLTVRFGGRAVLLDLDVAVHEREVLFLMGGSGCGKTTLLKALAGLLRPDEGEVRFEGRPLEPEGGPTRDALRRATGMVFQGAALLSSLSLAENVALPLRARTPALPPAVVSEVVRMRLAQVGLLEAIDLQPAQLSGGMRKRAGIARALALDPRLLLLDEPTGGLDPITSAEIDGLIDELRHDLGAAVVVVSHDLASARRLADRAVILGAGRTLAEGTWDEVQRSADEEVRRFLDRRARPRPAALTSTWEDS
jgi:phospholipid/cholesterol/gamma-HCH transport system ATP-binding protein